MIPIYYNDDISQNLTFLPFLVAHLDFGQDSIIIAPNSISESHDPFINKIYYHVNGINLTNIAIRAFIFESKLCLALIFPTGLTDRGGRSRLFISCGFLIKPEFMNLPNPIFHHFLKIILETINSCFSISLPEEGAERLHLYIRNYEKDNDFHIKISMALNFMLRSSQILGEIPIKLHRKNFLSYLKVNKKEKTPKIIYYNRDINLDDLIQIFLSKVLDDLKDLGQTGLQEIFSVNEKLDVGKLLMIPMPKIFDDAVDIKIMNWKKNRYLCIY